MSSSDPSHGGYRFELEDPDDDADSTASHDDYDDMPDEDDEDDDDDMDDEDDDEDEDDDVVNFANATIPPPMLNALASGFSSRMFRPPRHSDIPLYYANDVTHMPFDLSPDDMDGPDPTLVSLPPSRIAIRSGDISEHPILRSMLLDTFDSLSPRQVARLASELGGPIRLQLDTVSLDRSDPAYVFSPRTASGIPVCDTRMFLGDFASRGTLSAIHPLLLRPPVPPQNDQNVMDATRSLISTLSRTAGSGPSPPRPLPLPVRDPHTRVSEALANVTAFLNSIDQNSSANRRGDATVEASDVAPGESPRVPSHNSVRSAPSADAVMPAARSAPLLPLVGPSTAEAASTTVRRSPEESSSATESGADSTRAPRRESETAPRPATATTSDIDALTGARFEIERLEEMDLMRSVESLNMSSPVDLFSGHMSRSSRSSYDRPAHSRDRDRDKISSGVLKRWVYDPPSCGGDSLPAIFDVDVAHRSSRGHGRSSSPSLPILAPQTHESVNRLSTKIIGCVDTLLADMAKIDAKVADRELKEQLKKEKEEAANKKQEEDDVKTEEVERKEADGEATEAGEGDDDAADISAEDSAEVDGPQTEAPIVGEGDVEIASSREAGAADVPADEGEDGRPDAVMEAVDEEPEQSSEPQQEEETRAASDIDDTNNDNQGANSAAEPADGESAPASNDFSAVAAQRAAAAGISLDAPANQNPEVVDAAIESTGIDPAFLAALPDTMRAEILNQYYWQIRSSGGGDASASSAPSTTTVNQDFLIALPPALRAEVLELEAEFESRHQSGPNAGGDNAGVAATGSNEDGAGGEGSGAGVAAADMDNATFLATLPPDIREEILLTYADSFIDTLPPSVAAEARVLREREASSRLPWRGSGMGGFEGRRFPNGIRGSGQGRNGGRSQPRESPTYRWKQVDNAWLREGPKAADEPVPSLKADGLSALIRMHLLRRGHYGRTSLFRVFSHACKNTSSRELILEQLLQLITNSLSQDVRFSDSASESRRELEHSRQHGTTVRRALEMLTLLCKHDPLVAENLLGLPKTSEELASVPERVTDTTVLPHRHSATSFATLVALLDDPLFVRSNSHLEQLVHLISILCNNLPPTLCNNTDQRKSGVRRQPRRRLLSEENDEIHGSMTVFLDTHDDLAAGMYEVADDGDDDDDSEDEHDPFESPEITHPDRQSGRQEAAATKEEQKDKTKIVLVPPQYRIPGFRKDDLVVLTKVLLRQGCSDRTYERVSRSIGMLGELMPIRMTFVGSLVKIAVESGEGVHKEYEKLILALEEATRSRSTKKRREVVSSFSVESASNELTLLRVVKSLAALWEHEAEENATEESKERSAAASREIKNEGESHGNVSGDGVVVETSDKIEQMDEHAVSTQTRFRPSMVSGLQGLWNSLDRLLELVSEEARLKDGKSPSGSSGSSRSRAALMTIGRMKSANRSLSPVLARLSPMIEAFLITHSAEEPPEPKEEPKVCESPRVRNRPVSTPPPLEASSIGKTPFSPSDGPPHAMESQLSAFVERHRGPINALLRANPSLLETSFKGALRHPQAIDFDNKKAYFRNVIRRRSSETHAGTIRLNNIRRERVFDDSYQQLRLRTPDEMKGRLHVQFNGEEGVDAGGVTREWYSILARQIFDPNYVLFTRSAAKAATYQPDKRSYINREHLENFRFVGRIIGKAIYDGQLLDAYFTRSFYKHILGLKPTYHDIEAQDPEYYKSLKWMLENDITGIFDYTMSTEYDEFGKQTIFDMIPNGRNIPVTEENKADYVRLVTEVRMTKTIEKQIEAFKAGFYELIPHEDVKIFNELELELLMSGLPDIDMADLKANVEYTGYTASSPQINWFWRCVSNMDQEDLARLVMFVTGTSKVPLEGFGTLQGMNGMQKFQIHRVAGDSMRLPSAHTCFNQLDLPEYSTSEILSERLLRAVRECSVGFGFA